MSAKPKHRLAIEYRSLASLIPYLRNPLRHSKRHIEMVARSIEEFGWTNPILLDDKGVIVAGHGRAEGAKLLGMTEVPVVRLSSMTPSQIRAYRLADNQLARVSEWDQDLLTSELRILGEELNFDIGVIGFDDADLDIWLDDQKPAETEPVEEPDLAEPVVTRLGDLWHIGRHKLLCGDARDRGNYERLLGDRRADLIIADPPYNRRMRDITGLGKTQHPAFPMAVGEMSDEEFVIFLVEAMRPATECSKDGALHYIFADWRMMKAMLILGERVYQGMPKMVCVWAKNRAAMGNFYRSQYELNFIFKVGTAEHVNNFMLGQKGRYRTNLWHYDAPCALTKAGQEELQSHPTAKNVEMLKDVILDASPRHGTVLDNFVGAGGTLIAAHQTNRLGFGIELLPHYADIAIRRLQKAVGTIARLDGKASYTEVAADRGVALEGQDHG